MEPPIPPPRSARKHNSSGEAMDNLGKSEGTRSPALDHQEEKERSGVIQVSAEIHDAKTLAKESVQAEDKREKKKRKVKRRGTFTKKERLKEAGAGDMKIDLSEEKLRNSCDAPNIKRGSLTETISDSDSGKIKLIPLRPVSGRRRAPAGSATETLSDESDSNAKIPKFSLPLPPVPARRKSVPLPQSDKTIDDRPKSAGVVQCSEELSVLPAPVPAPRNSISKSNLAVERNASPYCTSSSVDYQDCDALTNRLRKHKKKRKLRDNSELSDAVANSNAASSTESGSSLLSTKQSSNKDISKKKDEMACITVHSCEPLHLKHFSRRQIVRVHVMDLTNKKYKRSALGKMDIQPVSTSPFEYRENRLTMPTWEEDLFLLEPLSHIVSVDTLLILEVIDCGNDEVLAWGFLKPVAANGALNSGKTLRLQLYKPGKTTKDNSVPKGFQWWSRAKYCNYKSTLFVTLNGVPSDLIITPRNEEINVKNKSEVSIRDEDNLDSTNPKGKEELYLQEIEWSRLPSLSCKLPNAFLATLDTGNSGSMAVAYSHSGFYIACQVGDNICLFTYKGELIYTMTGHQGLVYCLQWTEDDKYIVSSSADTTACVWDVSKRRPSPIQVLPHPSYVYSCCWVDEPAGLIVTACYDKYIRLWKLGSKAPVQLLSKHNGPVNSAAVIENGRVVTGDNLGIIVLWKLTSEGNLEFEKEIVLREIKGKCINKLVIHSGKKRMLVHTRDSVLRIVDIASGIVVQWFRGGLNNRLRCDSCFCGCGSRIFATCEDGSTCCWDAYTGQMIAIYTRLQSNGAASMDFHPRDHYMAVASHSSLGTATLSIVKYERELNGNEVGIIFVDSSHHDLDTSRSLSSSMSASHSNPSLAKDTSCSSPITTPVEKRKSKQKELSIFKSLLGKKKSKKGESNIGYQDTEVETNVSMKKEKVVRSTLLNSGQDSRDNRLSEIIKKMDKVLTAITSNKPM